MVCAIVFGAYFFGENRGAFKCQTQHLEKQIEKIEQTKNTKRILNDKVYRTDMYDIRRVLRDKYTIGEHGTL